MSVELLPRNSGLFEKAIAEAIEFPDAIGDGIDDLHGVKYHRPLNQSVAPHLVVEYGLGPISQFFETYEDLIDTGRAWQRLRGTPDAISEALSWIGYDDAVIFDQVRRRRRWHLFQIKMSDVPTPEEEIQRLLDAEYLVDLSDPARSVFFRGFEGYDVRGLEWSGKTWSNCLWGDSSGVRIEGNSVKWSHGRDIPVSGTAEAGKTAALGIDYTNGDPVYWYDPFTWLTPGVAWIGIVSAGSVKAWLLRGRRAHIGFYDDDGVPLAFGLVLVPATIEAIDEVNSTVDLLYTVRTRFGDGVGLSVGKMAVVFDLEHDMPASSRWVPASAVNTGPEITVGLADIEHRFLQTSRDLIQFTLTI